MLALTGTQEADRHGHLISGATETRGMRNHSDQRMIFVGGGHSEYQAGTNLRRQAEVNEPDLAPTRGSHA